MVWQFALHDHAIAGRSFIMNKSKTNEEQGKTNYLRIGLVQQSCVNDKKENLAKTIEHIKKAKDLGAKLILLQELHTSLYFCQTENVNIFDLAEPIPGPTTELLSSLAKQLEVVIIASLFEKRAAGLYHNTAVVFDVDGKTAGCYRKMHIPDDPGYYEKFYFTPGDLGFKPVKTSLGNLGVLVCWDQWYPEAARLMALAGADMLFYPTAIGWGTQEKDEAEKKRQREAWMLVQRAHAVANGIPVVVANRTGFEPAKEGEREGIQFWGSSFIAGPQGEIIKQASDDKTEVLIADIDLDRCEEVRRGWPFLRDRRIDDYADILKRYL
jgi:N-carbamoylputrescine amidase